jgi:nucleotide-binding universal stress UspA family protein
MRILICSDGTDPANKPATLGGLVAGPCQAAVTLLGIAEKPADDSPLRQALESEVELLGRFGVSPEIVIRAGEPIRQILNQTGASQYDLVVIGARRKGSGGLYWYSERTYEVIQAVAPPVLVATGSCETLQRFLVCTGGKHYIDNAVELSGRIAACVKAETTLLHIVAEPPALYADLVRKEEDVEALLDSPSELGETLRAQKEMLQKLGVTAEVRIRHGIVLDELFDEVRAGDYDLIVTGSSPTRGTFQHYIMGDLTRHIVNRADCPVLVARAGKSDQIAPGLWTSLKRIFTAG